MMNKKTIAIVGLVLILGIIITWWFIIPRGCPRANEQGANLCGYHIPGVQFLRVTPPATMQLLYNGTFNIDFINAFEEAEEITIEDIEIIHEGRCYNVEKRGAECTINEPEMGSKIPKGTMFEVVAYCPTVNKDADIEFLYITLTYKAIKDGEEITKVSEGGICIGNARDRDKFSMYAFAR